MTCRQVLGAALGIALTLAAGETVSAQTSAAAAGSLIVAGDVVTPLSIAPAELKHWLRTRVEVKEGDRTVAYEGVLVGEILKRAGAQLGAELRDGGVATYVVASATDGGYRRWQAVRRKSGSAPDCRAEGHSWRALDSDAGAAPGCARPEIAQRERLARIIEH